MIIFYAYVINYFFCFTTHNFSGSA